MCLSEQPRTAHHAAALASIHAHHEQQIAQTPRSAVAVLHARPDGADAANTAGIACRLHLYPAPAQGLLAYAVLSGAEGAAQDAVSRARIIIHQDGDLSRSGALSDAPPLFEFSACAPQSWRVADPVAGADDSIVSPIAAQIDVSVGWPGNTGIIGRRVSIVNASGRVAGDGVVGWN